MKRSFLKISGFCLFFSGAFVWLLGGARAGFSNDKIATVRVDEITGIQQTIYEDGFEPGFEFLALGFLGFATLSIAAAFLEGRQRISTNENE